MLKSKGLFGHFHKRLNESIKALLMSAWYKVSDINKDGILMLTGFGGKYVSFPV